MIFVDDFDDFQSAAPVANNNAFSSAPSSAKQPAQATSKSNDMFDLLGDDNFTSAPPINNAGPLSPPATMNTQYMAPLAPAGQSTTANQPAASGFPAGKSNDLWSQASGLVSLDSLGKGGNQNKPTVGPSMNSMKSNATASEWSSWANASTPANNLGGFSQPMKPATGNNQQQAKSSSNAFDDLLL